MHIDPAIEYRRSILTHRTPNQRLTTRMLLNELTHIMNHTRDSHKLRAALLGRLLARRAELLPRDDGQVGQRHAPVQPGAPDIEFLLLLLQAALFDLVVAEALQVAGLARLGQQVDGPFRGVVLVPGDGVAVVGRELVVEVVVAFAQRDERRDEVVPGRPAVVEDLLADITIGFVPRQHSSIPDLANLPRSYASSST